MQGQEENGRREEEVRRRDAYASKTDAGEAGDPIVSEVQKRLRESQEFWKDWRTEARDCYDMVAGRQWDEDDAQILRSQDRPPITFNRIGPVLDAVCGSEAQNRQEVKYFPREIGDSGVNELMSNAASWVRDRGNADVEENDAFRDALTCGYGATETRVSFKDNPDGDIEIERVDPLEIYPDPAARKRNFTDARWVIRQKWVGADDAKELWPEQFGELTAELPDLDAEPTTPIDTTDQDYTGNRYYNPRTREYLITEQQKREAVVYWRVLDPMTGQIVDVEEDRWEKMQKMMEEQGMPVPQAVQSKKWEWRRTIICGETLLADDPAPAKKNCSYRFITGPRDRNRRTPYGLVRAMKDPQTWANKWLSQIMHIVNTNAKGGVMWEAGAFDDPERAKRDWAKPDSWVQLNPGGVQKVQQRQPITYPQGLDQLMNFAISSIRDVTGVNLEILGLADRQQAGVLESQRKQAALTILAGWFDSLRAYRREQGKLLFEFIERYISDGRLIKIDSENGPKYLPLIHQPGTSEFDVIVDTAPASVNVKQQTFETLQMFLPAAMKMGIPVPPSLLKYLPIPESLAMDWQKLLQTNGVPPQVQEMMKKGQEQIQKMGQELQKRDQSLQKMQGDLMQAQMGLEVMRAKEATNNQSLVIDKMELDLKAKSQQVEAFRAETERLRVEVEAGKAQGDHQIKVAEMARDQEGDDMDVDKLAPMLEQLRNSILQEVSKIVNAPKTFQYDSQGRVTSMNGRPVSYGPDGRIIGIQ